MYLILQDGHCSDEVPSSQRGTVKYAEATTYVNRLLAAKLVYRTLYNPIGHVNVSENQSYSIRGYFIPAVGPGFQFITHIPLRQHWRIDSQV